MGWFGDLELMFDRRFWIGWTAGMLGAVIAIVLYARVI